MLKIKRLFTNHWQLLFWPLVATLVFLPACGRYTVLPSPDSAPFYPLTYRIDRFVNLLAESPSLSLDDLLELLLPPLFRHDFSYWLSVVATALGGYWLMRERDAPKTASAFAGGALAFAALAAAAPPEAVRAVPLDSAICFCRHASVSVSVCTRLGEATSAKTSNAHPTPARKQRIRSRSGLIAAFRAKSQIA